MQKNDRCQSVYAIIFILFIGFSAFNAMYLNLNQSIIVIAVESILAIITLWLALGMFKNIPKKLIIDTFDIQDVTVVDVSSHWHGKSNAYSVKVKNKDGIILDESYRVLPDVSVEPGNVVYLVKINDTMVAMPLYEGHKWQKVYLRSA